MGYSQTVVSGRPHLRQHAVEGQPLDAIASAQAADLQLAEAAVNLEREGVLPLGAADMQEGGLAAGRRSSRKPLSSTGMSQK